MSTANFGGTHGHRELLGHALAYFRSDKRIVGIVLGGSLAVGEWDLYSDVDLYAIVENGLLREVFGEREATANAVGSHLCGFAVEPVSDGSTDYYALYESPQGLIKFDFMYLEQLDFQPDSKWAGCLVLKDATGGRLSEIVDQSRPFEPSLPSSGALFRLDQEFWTRCWYAFGKIERGELWEAFASIHALRSDILLPFLDWEAGRKSEGYRRLESKESLRVLACLSATVAAAPWPDRIYEALREEINLYQELSKALAQRLGVSLDPNPGRIVSREIERRGRESED